MARDHRIGFRGRHLIRQVLRNRNQNVRRAAFNELMAHASRRHGRKMPAVPLALRAPGEHRPLTRKAKHLLHSLRQAKTWAVVRRLLAELHREIEQKIRRARAAQAARKGAKRVKRGAQAASRTVRGVARGTSRTARAVRSGVRKAADRHLAWAERRQAQRENGTRKPPVRVRVRSALASATRRGRSLLADPVRLRLRRRSSGLQPQRAAQLTPRSRIQPAPPRPRTAQGSRTPRPLRTRRPVRIPARTR